jgi:uncharacterized protein (TIGR02246 family)
MKRCWFVLAVGAACLLPGPAVPQEKEDPAHEELRALKRELTAAVNKGDVDAVLSHLDKDVVVTWLNGEVSRGPAGVREYYDRMTKGPQRKVESFATDPTVEELTHLYGNSGIAYGTSKDTFKLTDGSAFTVNSHWSATVVKQDGRWKIANFHASTDMFDNEVLHLALRRTASWTAAIALFIGFLLGSLVVWFLRRRPAEGSAHGPATPG